jgi:thimet oligopeptidase
MLNPGIRAALLLATLCASGPSLAQAPPVDQPPLWSAQPDAAAFERQEDEHLAAERRAIDALLGVTGPRTIANTLAPYDEAQRQLQAAGSFAGLMERVHPDAAFRDRATAVTKKVSAADTALSLDPAVYRALASLDVSSADPATRFYVQRTLRDYRLGGVNLSDAKRTRLKALQDELTDALSAFERNIADDTRTLRVASAADLEGLPQDFIDSHKPGPDGSIAVTTSCPDYVPVMKYARSDDLRRRLSVEFKNRAWPKNRAVLQRILRLRYAIARLLGYASWADLNAANKMVTPGAAVGRFVAELDAVTRDPARREYAMLLDVKRRTRPQARDVVAYEVDYLSEQLRREQYGFDSQALRPYLPYDEVKQGILDTAAALFHVSFRREADARAWDPSVETWDVVEGGRMIGRFYLDMHPRPGKYAHAEVAPVLLGIRGRQLPEGTLICNLPAPTATDPGLMDYSDVVSFFHEFGHLMHLILGGQEAQWIGISGIRMEWDFVEAPSQMLEEMMHSPQLLASFAHHYQTGAPIPAELVAAMNRAAAFGRAYFVARQNALSAISYDLYRAPPQDVSPEDVTLRDLRRYSPVAALPTDAHFYASFGHLAGYSSAYYTYMWDKVIAEDFFAQFDQRDPRLGDTPMRYRRAVLEPGGSVPAGELVRNFLGRPQDMRAFEKWIGEEFAAPAAAP